MLANENILYSYFSKLHINITKTSLRPQPFMSLWKVNYREDTIDSFWYLVNMIHSPLNQTSKTIKH